MPMVTLLITALVISVIIGITGIGLYLWQKSVAGTSEKVLPQPPPNARSLFAPDPSALKEDEAKRLALVATEQMNN